MKYIFVTSSFNIGGVATSFSTLVDSAIDKNDEVELHIVDQIADIQTYVPDRVKIKHIHCYYDEIYSYGAKKGIIFLYHKYGLWPVLKRIYVWLLKKFCYYNPFILSKQFFDPDLKSTCDVCVVLKENEPTLFYAFHNIKARKRIAFFHTAGCLRDEYIPIYCSPQIDEIITVSQGNKDFLIENMPEATSKIHVIHNIVPVEKIRALSQTKESLFDATEKPILYVGRICEEKGAIAILEAAKLLKDEFPKIHWYFLGRYDGRFSQERLEEKLAEKHIEDKVTVISAIKNPYPYIAQTWLIVNPSQFESYGMVIREGQILGKPVIATKTYGGVELIEDGKTGLLIDIDDSYQMSEVIKNLYNNENLYSDIVTNLKATDFDETEKIKELFNNLMK